jgi:hypothetical protein
MYASCIMRICPISSTRFLTTLVTLCWESALAPVDRDTPLGLCKSHRSERVANAWSNPNPWVSKLINTYDVLGSILGR